MRLMIVGHIACCEAPESGDQTDASELAQVAASR